MIKISSNCCLYWLHGSWLTGFLGAYVISSYCRRRSRLRGSRLPGSLWAGVVSSDCCRRVSRPRGSRPLAPVGAYVISSQPASWEPAPRLP